jgi:hypothetical protein
MITDMKGSAKSEASTVGDALAEENRGRLEREEPPKRQSAVEQAKAIAVDAARLALNLGILTEAIHVEAREAYEIWLTGKKVSKIAMEGVDHQEQLERQLSERGEELDAERERAEKAEDSLRRTESELRVCQEVRDRVVGERDEARAEAEQFKSMAEGSMDSVNNELLPKISQLQDERDRAQSEVARQLAAGEALRMAVAERLRMPASSEWSQLLPLIGMR